MGTWQELGDGELRQLRAAQSEVSKSDGVTVELSVSPYDIPQAVRGYFGADLKRYFIEFRYIQDEPFVTYQATDHVKLRVGKNSVRLYAIEIDVESLRARHANLRMGVSELISKALEGLEEEARAPARLGNYKAVGSIVQSTPEVFVALEAA